MINKDIQKAIEDITEAYNIHTLKRRMVMDNPENNPDALHNLVFIKNNEVWIHGVAENYEDMSLRDYIRANDSDFADSDNEDIDTLLEEDLSTQTQVLYSLAVGFAFVRERLKFFEDKYFGRSIYEQ